jgi:hypothetical protein
MAGDKRPSFLGVVVGPGDEAVAPWVDVSLRGDNDVTRPGRGTPAMGFVNSKSSGFLNALRKMDDWKTDAIGWWCDCGAVLLPLPLWLWVWLFPMLPLPLLLLLLLLGAAA